MPDRPPLSERIFPELAQFETDEQRRKAWEYVWFEMTHNGVNVFFAVALILGMGVNLALACLLVGSRAGGYLTILGSINQIAVTVIVGAIAGLVTLAGYWLARRKIRRLLRRQLHEAGVPICMQCGYDLHGLTKPRCPECGCAVELCRPDEHESYDLAIPRSSDVNSDSKA